MLKFYRLQAVMLVMTAFFNVMQAQELRGIVIDEHRHPVENVTVSIQNKLIVRTNVEGVFVLSNKFKVPIELTFSHPDYTRLNVTFTETDQQFIIKKTIPLETLNAVTVSARTASEKTLITPTAIIGSATFSEQNPVDLVSTINQTSGIYIQSGAINTNRIVIRGVGARTLYGTNKIRGYFDGIPITSGVGETAIDVYDPEDLKSIEIIKGPKATQYGTNLGGTLLLTSKTPENEGLSIRNNTTVGSFGLFKNTITSEYSNSKINVHLTYDHLELDGFRENSNYNRNAIFLNSRYRFNAKTELSILVNYVDYTAHIASSIGKTAFEDKPSQAAFTWKQAQGFEAEAQNLTGLSLQHEFSNDFKNVTSIFYSYSDHYEPRPFNILDEYTKGFGARSVFTKTYNFLNRKAEWTFGAEFFQDEYHWNTIENRYQDNNGNGSLEGELLSTNKENRQQLNVFSRMTIPVLEQVTLQFGINYNKTHYDFRDEFNLEESDRSAVRDFDAIVAPNVNIVYQFTDNQNIYANASYGFNYPSVEEALTPEGLVNPDISPEKGFNYELGSDSYFLNRNLHLLASVYLLNIKDLLVAERVGDDQYIGRNAGKTIHKGLELSTDYKLGINENLALLPYVNMTFNWHRFDTFVSDDSDYSGNKLTGVPNMTIASGIAFKYKNAALYSNLLYVGEMPINDANTLYSDAYAVTNLKATYQTKLFKSLAFQFNLGVNNVFDRTYASAILINATGFNNSEPRYYYQGNPRNYYGGISLRYHL